MDRMLNRLTSWRAWVAIALLVVMGAVAGCNTIEGFGKDIESLGESMQEDD